MVGSATTNYLVKFSKIENPLEILPSNWVFARLLLANNLKNFVDNPAIFGLGVLNTYIKNKYKSFKLMPNHAGWSIELFKNLLKQPENHPREWVPNRNCQVFSPEWFHTFLCSNLLLVWLIQMCLFLKEKRTICHAKLK